MKIALPSGRSVRLQFRYLKKRTRITTLAQIIDRDTGTILSSGQAICCPFDYLILEAYDKDYGRRKALRRALPVNGEGLPFDRPDRIAIWTAYNTRQEGHHGQPDDRAGSAAGPRPAYAGV